MSQKKKKALKIVIIIILILTLIWMLGLRLVIWYAAKQVTPDMGPAAEYFTEYNIKLSNVNLAQTTSPSGLSMYIPDFFEEKEISLENTLQYIYINESEDFNECIVFMNASDLSDMNLFSEENMATYPGGILDKFAVNKLMKGFEDLGHGLPDSAYNTFKSTALLTADDYSFWNWQKGFAYVVSGMIKNTSFLGDYNYIYETEDICGIIHVRELTGKDYKYYIVADMFSTDDLGTAHGLLIKTNHLPMAYAMINSITIE